MLKKNWIVGVLFFVTALAVGVFTSLEQFLLLKNSIALWGQHLVIFADTHAHVLWPQVREVLDGHWLVADTQAYEHRLGPPLTPWPWFPIFFYAIFGKIFGMAQIQPWASLIVATLSFMLLAQLLTELTGRRVWGILFSILLFASRLAPIFFFPGSIDELKELITLFIPGLYPVNVSRVDFLPYESFNPGWLVLGLFLFLMHRAMRKNNNRLVPAVGVVAGVLIYAYPFHWIFGVMALGAWALSALPGRHWKRFWYVVAAIGIDFAVTIPYWLNQWLLRKQGILNLINLRNAGFEYSHQIRFSQWSWYLVWAVLSLILYYWAKRKGDTRPVTFIGALFAGVFFCLNLQVITGFNIHTDHWVQKLSFLPLGFSLFLLFTYLTDWLAERRILRKTFSIALLSVLVLGTVIGGVGRAFDGVAEREMNFPFDRDVFETYKWINTNAAADSVVLNLSTQTSAFLTIYTSARSFLPHALNTHATDEEIFDRLDAAYAIYGVPVSVLAQQFKDDPEARGVMAQFFWVKYRPSDFDASLTGYTSGGVIPKEVSDKIINDYARYHLDMAALLTRYHLDYILETPYERAIGKTPLAKLPYVKTVFKHGNVILYQVLKDKIKK